jgi:hypothetical protein
MSKRSNTGRHKYVPFVRKGHASFIYIDPTHGASLAECDTTIFHYHAISRAPGAHEFKMVVPTYRESSFFMKM